MHGSSAWFTPVLCSSEYPISTKWHMQSVGFGGSNPLLDMTEFFFKTKIIAQYYTKACKIMSFFLQLPFFSVNKSLCAFYPVKYVIVTLKRSKMRLAAMVPRNPKGAYSARQAPSSIKGKK